MITNMTKSSRLLKTLSMSLIILLSISVVNSAVDYCITNKPYDVVGLMGNESVSLTLGDYVRGYNLTFTSNQPMSARPFNPLNVVGSTPFGFKEGYRIVSADVLESSDKKWYQNGVALAQKDSKSIGIVVSQFSGTRNVNLNKLEPQYYTLPSEATCFSANVVDRSSNIVIDCQTTDENNLQDLVCFIDTDNKSISKCVSLDSLNQVKDRKTEVLFLGKQVYLLSGSYSRDSTSSDMTYLTIYRVDLATKSLDFVNIIDGYQLNLDYDIIISDFDILKNGNILIHDIAKSQLLFVQYTLSNEISLIGTPWVYGSAGVEIEVTNLNTVLIATNAYVEEWDLSIRMRVFRYELEKGDNNVVGLGANSYGVVVETERKFLYVYQRIMGTVNYILGSVYVGNKDYLISPYSNVFYVFNDVQYDVYELTSGSLRLNNFDQSVNVTVTAQSTSSTCKFIIQIIKLNSTEKIVEKQDISKKHFTAENSQAISLNLEDIYSGQYLTYEVPKSTNEVKFTLDHIAAYEVTTGLKDSILTQIVNINKTAYMLLGLTSDKAAIEMCITNDDTKQIVCNQIYNSSLYRSDPILLTGRQRSSGQIVFVWTFAKNQHEYLSYRNGSFSKSYTLMGNQYEYSSVVIAEDKIFFVFKGYASIQINKDLSPNFEYMSINPTNFNSQTDQITGFYPRQVYLHPRSTELFYVKFPQHVCLMTMIGTVPKTIECTKVLDNIIPDDKWNVIVGTYTFVVFSPEGIKEYSILGNKGTELHTINLSFTWPVYYSSFLNTAIFKTQEGRAVYYKLNKPLADCLYFSTHLTDDLKGQSDEFFTSEGSWTISTKNWRAYRQSYNTKLSIELIGDNKSFKENIQFNIKVKGFGNQSIDTNNNITIIHYPTNITQVNATNDVISLPAQANNQVYQIDPEKYLTGPKSKYSIVCDYCGPHIKFEGAFKNKTQNPQIIGSESIIEVFNNHVIVLTNNRINLVNSQGKLVTYKIVEHVKKCVEMVWNEKIGLLVICQDETGQEIFGFNVNEDNITQWNVTYPIHSEAAISYVDEIIISEIDANTFWVFVEDNDITDLKEKFNKKANVKVFVWTKDALDFKGILTSESFGIVSDIVMPINDIDVVNDKVLLASIGNVGIGYATLANQKDAPNVLTNPQVVPLRSIPQVQAFLLDDTIFQQVELLPTKGSSDLSILLTSSTSVAMILEFTLATDSTLTFKKIQQSFNRYGTFASVNWHAVTQNALLLSFYNVQDGEEYITLYKRSNATMIDFVEALTVKINTYQLGEHSVLLTSTNILFVSDVGNSSTDAKITRYDLSLKYNLILSYTQPGNFNNITLTATNQYSSEHTQIKVSFAKNDDDSNGVKWYTVMIIALIVLIIVGVAYGMYLKMIKHRKDKKVSLLTEGEQVDEVV